MSQWLEAVAAVEKLGVIGILTGVTLALAIVVKKLWVQLQDTQKKLLKVLQGKDISE